MWESGRRRDGARINEGTGKEIGEGTAEENELGIEKGKLES